MTREEAIRILDPSTTREALAEIEYYAGFNGYEAVIKAVEDACIMAIEALQKRPKGRWEEVWQGNYIGTIQCSACGRKVNVDTPIDNVKIIRKYPFCHCGADCRGEEE